MEYYPWSGNYVDHQYEAGQFPVPNPPVAFDPTNVNVEHYTNFEEGDHDIPNFDDDPPPHIHAPMPMETREAVLHTQSSMQEGQKVNTVYKKAPGAPKRFKSSYVHFFTDFVEKKKQQLGPDGLPIKMDISLVSKECSGVWKALAPEQRQYWDSISEKEKEEYNKQKAEYQGPWRIATHKVKKKKEGAPKRSPSAFFLFANVRRPLIKAKYPGMPNTMVVKTCSEVWKGLPASEKAPFLEEEKKLRAQYHIDSENWKKRVDEHQQEDEIDEKRAATKYYDEAADDLLPPEPAPHPTGEHVFMNPPGYVAVAAAVTAAPSRSRKRRRDPHAPKRSPPAFFLFVNHCRHELKIQYPEMRHTELVKMLGQKWSNMSEEEKKPFRDHEEQLRQQYHIDIKNYKKCAVPEQDYHPDLQIKKPGQKVEQAPVLNSTHVPLSPPVMVHVPHQEVHYQQQPMAHGQPNYYRPPPMRDEDLSYQQAMNYFD